MKTRRWLAVGCFLGSVLLASPLLAAPDAWITAKTKIKLFGEEALDATRIHVDTERGQVVLHGMVDSEKDKARAERAARSIDGAKGVRNLLQVVPDERREAVKENDEEIEKAVKSALDADAQLEDSDIDIASVQAGVVLLGGKASSIGDEVRAMRIARSVAGVRKVASEVKAPAMLAEDEIGPSAPGHEPSTLGDAWITTAVKMRLLADGDTPGIGVNVDTEGGEVTLFGVVPTDTAKAAAEREARKVSGVRDVDNLLQVVPEKQQKQVAHADDAIESAVEKALEGESALEHGDIEVEVKNGVARLTGTVRSGSDRLLAAVTARSVAGVRSVHEELTVAASTASK